MTAGFGDEFPTIVAAAAAGGEWALTLLFRELSPSVQRYLRAQAGQDADDLASETWLSVAGSLRSFSGDEDAFRAWVFTIAKRRVADHLRKRGRRRAVPVDAPAEAPSAEDAALDGRLGDEAARRIVAALPDEQAQIVLLRVVAGLSVDEVAAIVGRRPGTVRVLQHRALRRLAEDFSGEL